MKLVLASGSETRRRMLAAAGVPFAARNPEVDEEALKNRLLGRGAGAAEIALELAQSKALSLAADKDVLVIGSDQVLERDDGSILSKAQSREEAADQLNHLAGRTHRLHSAAVLAGAGGIVWGDTQSASMTMRRFSPEFLEHYLASEYDAVRFNVGGYRIEGMGAQLFEEIDGSHFAIMGLPLLPLLTELRRRGILVS
jgi:septum formation protein